PPKGYIEALETRLQRMESVLGNLVQSGNLPESVINSNLEWININENSFKNNIVNNLQKPHDSPTSNDEDLYLMNSQNGQDSDTDERLSSDDDQSCDLSDTKELLKDEFDSATLTNIQALVLLAGNLQSAKNSSSWLYAGIAIRLAQDMGLHRDSSKWNLD
ncbi:10358_t:CDS:2, partial [Racocetra fulgida]